MLDWRRIQLQKLRRQVEVITGERLTADDVRAYALNPDQPPVARPAEPVAPEGHAGHRKSFGHGRQVPALLMKRKSSEREKV